MSEKLPLPIDVWQRTPPEARELLLYLEEVVQENKQLRLRIEQLESRVKELEEQLALNSKNSSKPPSSDGPKDSDTKKDEKKDNKQTGKKRRKRGGQPGHEGKTRELKPVDEVDSLVHLKPKECRGCGSQLSGEDPTPWRHQVTELPEIAAQTIEYQFHNLCCEECGMQNHMPWPDDVPKGAFGPRLQSVIALCSGKYQQPKRSTQEMAQDFFGVSIGLGSVSEIERRASDMLEEPHKEAHQYVQKQSGMNVDETGFRQEYKRAWLWTMTTCFVTVFWVAMSRGSQIAKELIGVDYPGIVGTDRWGGYNWLNDEQRQFCWAHLRREFEKFKLRKGQSEKIGEHLLRESDKMFHWWHRVRDGTLSRKVFEQRMKKLRKAVEHFLQRGVLCDHKKTAGTCKRLLTRREALWTFVKVEGIEPTNNAAERVLRPAVIWRKRSFGTQSSRGSRFVERMLTVVTTLKQQKRSVMEYMVRVFEAQMRGEAAPSILPKDSP